MTKRGKGLPHLNALLLADRVYEDKSGKNIIAGTFDTVYVAGFPMIFTGGATLYMNVSDFQGSNHFYVRLVRLSDGTEIAKSSDVPISHDDPLKSAEIKMELPPLQFPEEGLYALEIMWNGNYLGQRKLHLVKKESPHG